MKNFNNLILSFPELEDCVKQSTKGGSNYNDYDDGSDPITWTINLPQIDIVYDNGGSPSPIDPAPNTPDYYPGFAGYPGFVINPDEGGGSVAIGTTTTNSQIIIDKKAIVQNAFFNLTQTLEYGVLMGKEGENITVNHNILNGKYDGIDITKGQVQVSVGTDGSHSLGVVIGNTTYAVGIQSAGSYSFTQTTNINGAITTSIGNLDINSAGAIGAALTEYGFNDIIPEVEGAFIEIAESGTIAAIVL